MSNHSDSLASRTVRNVAWLGSSQAVRQVTAILTTILVARFLGPTEYGIFAMTLFVNELAQIFIDFGIGTALVQRKTVDQRMLSTCFWINLVIGSVAAGVVIASGPFVAAYFKQPMVAHLLLVSALNLAVAAVAVLPQAILARNLAFRDVAIGATIGSLSGAAATLVMAAAGFGVWSLAFQPLIGTSVNLIYLLWRSRWRPTLEFDLGSISGVLRFSGHMLAGNVVGHFTRNLPHLLLGPSLGAASLGLLGMAMTVAFTPVAQFTSVVVRATFPAFAKLQESKQHMYQALLRSLEVVSLITFPVLVGLALMASDLMPAVFGPQWAGTAPLVSIFCVLSMLQCITPLSISTLIALGRSDIGMKLAFASLPLVGIPLWLARDASLTVAAVVLATATAANLLLGFWFAVKNLGCGWSGLLRQVSKPLGCSLLMGLAMAATAWASAAATPLPRMLAMGAAGTGVYLVATWCLNRQALQNVLTLLRNALGQGRGATPAATAPEPGP